MTINFYLYSMTPNRFLKHSGDYSVLPIHMTTLTFQSSYFPEKPTCL